MARTSSSEVDVASGELEGSAASASSKARRASEYWRPHALPASGSASRGAGPSSIDGLSERPTTVNERATASPSLATRWQSWASQADQSTPLASR